MKILLDNGHGFETSGKRSPDGHFREYAYNRYLAFLIKLYPARYENRIPESIPPGIRHSELVRSINLPSGIFSEKDGLFRSRPFASGAG